MQAGKEGPWPAKGTNCGGVASLSRRGLLIGGAAHATQLFDCHFYAIQGLVCNNNYVASPLPCPPSEDERTIKGFGNKHSPAIIALNFRG